jgi:anti-anti-sigma regulatory factor
MKGRGARRLFSLARRSRAAAVSFVDDIPPRSPCFAASRGSPRNPCGVENSTINELSTSVLKPPRRTFVCVLFIKRQRRGFSPVSAVIPTTNDPFRSTQSFVSAECNVGGQGDAMMSEDASIAIEQTPDGAKSLRLTGEASVFQAAELHRAAKSLAEETGGVRLECSELRSIDFAIGQILLALQRELAAEGRSFCIRQPSDEVSHLLKLVGLEQGDLAATNDSHGLAVDASSPKPSKNRP